MNHSFENNFTLNGMKDRKVAKWNKDRMPHPVVGCSHPYMNVLEIGEGLYEEPLCLCRFFFPSYILNDFVHVYIYI